MGLSDSELHRYARQILLPQVGGGGQERLKRARVLCVGAGGLGSPAALYLASAGVGTLGLIDNGPVEPTNLHRQILHFTADVGRPKVTSAKSKLLALNPNIAVNAHRHRLKADNAFEVLSSYDIVVDGSDNFATRYLVNDACVMKGIPLVSGAVLQWQGQVATILPRKGPCYRCLFPEPPDPSTVQSCSEAGVMGSVAGVIGCLQATETIKWILEMDDLVVNRLLVLDFLRMTFRDVPFKRRLDCVVCGDRPILTRLSDQPLPNCEATV